MTYTSRQSLIAIAYESPPLRSQALALAQELDLPLTADPADPTFAFLLVLTAERLELREQGPTAPGPVYVDFIGGAVAHRRRFGGGRGQALAKAVGLKGGANPRVLDATAGLGRDAFVLACLGCTVQLVERSPLVATLLRHGLERAARDPEIGALVRERLCLRVADSHAFMSGLGEQQRPDVVYLDPMYPHHVKAALVKKEMRTLRCLVGEDQDAPRLLAAALGCARRRVVVKRPIHAPVLEGPKPGTRIAARNTRFDVYVISSAPR